MNNEINQRDLENIFDDENENESSFQPDPAHVVAHRQRMLEKYNKLGIKLTGDIKGTMAESTGSGSQADLFAKIQKIKAGANRQAVKAVTQAMDSVSAPSPPPINMPRKTKTGQSKPASSGKAPQVQTFDVKKTSELSQIESMFDDTDSGYYNTGGGNDFKNLDIETSDAGIDITSQFREIMKAKYQAVPQPVSQPAIKKANTAMESISRDELATLIESISKKTSADMLKVVLKEFSSIFAESQKKNQNVFEVYNKEKNIIKIGNQLYQITPVTIKKKTS